MNQSHTNPSVNIQLYAPTYSGGFSVLVYDQTFRLILIVQTKNERYVRFKIGKRGCYRIVAKQDNYPCQIRVQDVLLSPNRREYLCFSFGKGKTTKKITVYVKVLDVHYPNILFEGVDLNIGFHTS